MSLNGNGRNDDGDDEGHIVKVRGLPWSTTVDEIIDFFRGCMIKNGREGVHIVMTKEGRPSGEAFVVLETENDVDTALKRDREYVGTRYIEVFKCQRSEMDWIVRRSGSAMDTSLDDGCVRLRGLPFECTRIEIAQFFAGLEIDGISLPMDQRGRSTGEAFVQFKTKENAEKALLKHKEKIGHRYIEIFRSNIHEICPENRRPYPSRPAPYDARDRFGGPNRFRGGPGMGPPPMMPPGTGMGPGRGFRGGFADDMDDDDWSWRWGPRGGGPGPQSLMGSSMRNTTYSTDMAHGGGFGGGYGGFGGGGGGTIGARQPGAPFIVFMRGLPFRATKQDIADFFRPIIPLSIDMNPSDKGRAEVEFRTKEDACAAMHKDKSYMSHRYIELFLDGPSAAGGGGGGGGPRNGGGDRDFMSGSRFKRN